MGETQTPFQYEENCRRLAKRFKGKLHISSASGPIPLINWSALGALLKTTEFPEAEQVEIRLPCSDGEEVIKVHLRAVRREQGSTGVEFVFNSPQDAAKLAAYSHHYGEDKPCSKKILQAAAKPVEALQNAEAEEVTKENVIFRWARVFPVILTIIVIIGIGIVIIPHLRSQLAMKIGERERYSLVAQQRLLAAEVQYNNIVEKIASANNILEDTTVTLTKEQLTLFQMGIDQLTGEMDLQLVNLNILRANLEEVKKGNYFFEKEVLGPFSTQFHMDSAPYLTQLMAEIADESRLLPKTPQDILRYQQVAEQRYQGVVAESEQNQAKLKLLEEFEERYSKMVAEGSFAHNTMLFLARDKQMLYIEQARLDQIMKLLKENWLDTLDGNFTLETRVLDKFNPSPNPPPATFDYNFTR